MTAADQSDQTVENPLAKRPSTYDVSGFTQMQHALGRAMLETTIAGSLPKPSWLAELEKLWPAWRLEGAWRWRRARSTPRSSR